MENTKENMEIKNIQMEIKNLSIIKPAIKRKRGIATATATTATAITAAAATAVAGT